MKPTKLFPLVGAALIITGCWFPWLKLEDETRTGFIRLGEQGYNNNLVDFAGNIVIALAVVSTVFSFLKKFWLKILSVLIALSIPVVAFAKFSAEKNGLGEEGSRGMQLGIGFWMISFGAIIIVMSCLFALRRKNE